MNLMEAENFLSEDEESETHALRAMERCPKCGTAMDAYIIDEKRKLHIQVTIQIVMVMSLKKVVLSLKVMMDHH